MKRDLTKAPIAKSLIVMLIPLAYILSSFTSLAKKGIWWTYPITYIFTAVLTLIWFISGKWKKRRVTSEIVVEEEIIAP